MAMWPVGHHQCQVCDLPVSIDTDALSKSSGQNPMIIACQACRKFFLRNRTKTLETLRCLSTTNNCTVDKSTATAIGSGVMWRMACPRCRLAKCFAIGLGEMPSRRLPIASKPTTNKECGSKDNEEQPMPDDEPPQQVTMELAMVPTAEGSSIENSLSELIKATNQLSLDFETTPLKVSVKVFPNEVDAWRNLMTQHAVITQSIIKFANSLPAFCKLPVEEKQALIKSAGSSMALAQSNRFGPHPVNSHPANATGIIQFFPEFDFTLEYCAMFHSLLEGWKPNQVEYACLVAMLLFQSAYAKGESNNKTTEEIGLIIHAALMQLSDGNVDDFKERLQNILKICKTFQTASAYRNAVLDEALRRRPYLLMLNPQSATTRN